MTQDIEGLGSTLGLALSRAQIDQLQMYLGLLLQWNATYNLTAVRDPVGMLTQHLADCLAVVPLLKRQGSGGQLLDVGSGGGLPGVVLAIACPDWHVSCVDTVGKKVAFIRQAAGVLDLAHLRALHTRVEHLAEPRFDVITARALGSLASLVSGTTGCMKPGGVWMAMKGRVPEDEIAAVPKGIDVFHVEPVEVPGLDAQRCVVWMRESRAADLALGGHGVNLG